MSDAIAVRGLRKSYGALEAVRGVDLTVATGEVFALLGPNGAGKTTTVEILEGHRLRSSGEVSVLGYDPGRGERALKRRIGIVLQETGVEPYLTVAEAVDLYRGYYPSPRPRDEVLAVVGLADKGGARVNTLSGGQKRRLDVAIGLCGDPELLFLDEPTTGFDPAARRGAWEMIRALKALGKTVLLTTHYMDEAQALADRVAIIVGGLIVAEGPPDGLVAEPVTAIRFRVAAGAPPLPERLAAEAVANGDRIELRAADPTALLHELTGWSLSAGVRLEALEVARPTLEEVYLSLTGDAEDVR